MPPHNPRSCPSRPEGRRRCRSAGSPGKPHGRPRHLCGAQPDAARHKGGQQHDQQRPEIVDQVRLGGRRQAQGDEIKRMIGEQPRDREEPERERRIRSEKRRVPPVPKAKCCRLRTPRRTSSPAAGMEEPIATIRSGRQAFPTSPPPKRRSASPCGSMAPISTGQDSPTDLSPWLRDPPPRWPVPECRGAADTATSGKPKIFTSR